MLEKQSDSVWDQMQIFGATKLPFTWTVYHLYTSITLSTRHAQVWRKKSEGLEITTKGSKELPGGRRVHVMVAIAYGKGVVLRVPYT